MAKRKSFLVKRGKMTEGEKSSLVNFYLAFYAPASVRRGATRDAIDEQYPFDLGDVRRLVKRGLVRLTYPTSQRRGGSKLIDMSPQGVAVARVILGLTKRRRRKPGRRKNAGPLNIAYEIGWWAPAEGRIVETLGYVSGTSETPIGHLKAEAARQVGVPRSQIRLRQTLEPKAHWF